MAHLTTESEDYPGKKSNIIEKRRRSRLWKKSVTTERGACPEPDGLSIDQSVLSRWLHPNQTLVESKPSFRVRGKFILISRARDAAIDLLSPFSASSEFDQSADRFHCGFEVSLWIWGFTVSQWFPHIRFKITFPGCENVKRIDWILSA